MIKTLLVLMVLVVFTAQDCEAEFGDLINKPGTISVTNSSDAEAAVIAILADDVKSYPTVAAGASATIKTNVGGRYEVRVVMTPENALKYKDELTAMRRLVEKQLDGTADVAEKTRLFVELAGIKAAIQQHTSGNGAGCAGLINLSTAKEESVLATIRWSPTAGGGGFWDVTCGGN